MFSWAGGLKSRFCLMSQYPHSNLGSSWIEKELMWSSQVLSPRDQRIIYRDAERREEDKRPGIPLRSQRTSRREWWRRWLSRVLVSGRKVLASRALRTFLINRWQSCIKDLRVLVRSILSFYLDPNDHSQKSCNHSTGKEPLSSLLDPVISSWNGLTRYCKGRRDILAASSESSW